MKTCAPLFGPHVTLVGDPVDVVTGASLDAQADFVLAGPLPLPWYRTHDSSKNWLPGQHGWGQTHYYDRRLAFDLDGLRYRDSVGDAVGFPALARDGDRFLGHGYALRRLGARRYELRQAGHPTAVFEADPGKPYARLQALEQDGATVRFGYDRDSQLETIRDSLGRAVHLEYDGAGRVARIALAQPAGRWKPLAAYEYDGAGNLTRATDPYRNVMRVQYDGEHRPTLRTDRRGYAFRFEYDALGRCTLAGGEDGVDEVRLAYEPRLSATLVTRPDGGRWLYLYDDAGTVTRLIEPDGAVRFYAKDDAGRVAQEIDPLGRVTARLYDATGAMRGTLDSLGDFRPDGDEGPVGPPAEFEPLTPAEWDYGGLFAPIAPAPERVTVEEDECGLVSREAYPDGTERRWGYDANGNVTRATDRQGAVTRTEYASWNLPVAETDALGATVRLESNAARFVTAVTDAGGTRSEYGYDLKDRLVEVRRHGRVRETYDYDAAGNLVGKRDGDGRPLLAWARDIDGLAAECRLASGEVRTFSYLANGLMKTATSASAAVAFTYDDLGRRTGDRRGGFGVQHRHGADGLEETVVLQRFRVGYEWEAPDALVITDPVGGLHRLHFAPGGRVTRTGPGGLREVSRYDAAGRCLARETPTWSRGYDYSPEGELAAGRDSLLGPTAYRYDARHRLVGSRQGAAPEEPIELDAAGNLLRMPGLAGVTLAPGNRLLEANGARFEYDRRDNLSHRHGPAGTTRYLYDSDDMLVRVERDGAPPWTAEYDPLGRRVRKTSGAAVTEFYWDGDRLAAERGSGGGLRVYLYADACALVPLAFLDSAHEQDAGTVYSVHADQIGTPVAVSDAQGRFVWRATVEPYGRAHVAPDSTLALAVRFPGHYFDEETGLQCNRFRYYQPETGRYLQSDPIGLGGGFNLYAYPASPLTEVDLKGLMGKAVPADESKNTSKARIAELREKTPNDERREDVNQDNSRCVATGAKTSRDGKPLAADHIVPFKEIAKMKGFGGLSKEQQLALVNLKDNFQPLTKSANSSKGAKTVADWDTIKGKDIEKKRLAALKKQDKAARAAIKKTLKCMKKDVTKPASECVTKTGACKKK